MGPVQQDERVDRGAQRVKEIPDNICQTQYMNNVGREEERVMVPAVVFGVTTTDNVNVCDGDQGVGKALHELQNRTIGSNTPIGSYRSIGREIQSCRVRHIDLAIKRQIRRNVDLGWLRRHVR